MSDWRTLDLPHYVYWHVDRYGLVLYVGCTHDVRKRNAQHRRCSEWYPHVRKVRSSESMNRGDALHFESAEIARLRPPYNKRKGYGRRRVAA